MAVIDSKQTISNNVSGFDKGIHSSARTMMLDNLQGAMYNKPIESAVRECVSNAVDAVKEKNTARKILLGQAKVSDYYLTREDVKDKIANADDDIYQDSEFNASYYDLAWLSNDDTVKLQYIVNEQTKRDQFVITDPGVGLGGSRLEGFFSLGYSSKRLNSGELGGFGLGAKSPLATGVESYRMMTRYNGKEYCFDIYSHKVDCVYGKWGDNGNMNSFTEFQSVQVPEKYMEKQLQTSLSGEEEEVEVQMTRMVPYKAYYKDTKEKNGTTIYIEAKKHNRAKYFEAVRSQLMYLQHEITFVEVSPTGTTIIPFKTEAIYEDDDLVLPEKGYYNKPHFVIKGVSYGPIDFNEADLAVKLGAIGVKFNMEELDVVPSRESVQYSAKTTAAIIKKYASVSKTVERKIQEELDQKILLDWIRACNKVMQTAGNANSMDPISRMSSFVDSTELQPTFLDTGIKYTSDIKKFITPLLKMQFTYLEQAPHRYSWDKNNKQKRKVSTAENTNIMNFNKPLYFQVGATSTKTNGYLAHIHDKESGFCTLRLNTSYTYLEDSISNLLKGKVGYDEFVSQAEVAINTFEGDAKRVNYILDHAKKAAQLITLLDKGVGNSKVDLYDAVVIPEGFKLTEESTDSGEITVEDSTDYEAIKKAKALARQKEVAKQRRENKAFIGYQLANKKVNTYSYKAGFVRTEITPTMLDAENSNIVYGSDDDDKAFEFMIALAKQKGAVYDNQPATYYWNEEFKALKVAKTNLRNVKFIGTPVEEHLLNIEEDGTLKAIKEVRQVLTAKTIHQLLGKKSNFLRNFSEVNQEVADIYKRLSSYVAAAPNVNTLDEVKGQNKFIDLFNSYYDVNLAFIKHEKLTEEERTELLDSVDTSKFDIDVTDVDLIDRDVYEDAKKIEAFVDVYGNIFKHIDSLTDKKKPRLDNDLIVELREILDAKKDQLEYTYQGIN